MAVQDLGWLSRQRYREAILIGLALVAVALAILHEDWAWRAERVLYDLGLSLSARPAPDDIVIVAIDDRSIAEIGVWPWRRAVHATLLERLANAHPRAVFLDLLLSEPDSDPRQDALLASALRKAAPVMLPVAWYSAANAAPLLLEPVAALREAASLVQAEAQPDSDGIMRHVFLRAGLGRPDLPHAALALLRTGGEVLPGNLQIERAQQVSSGDARTWVRDERMAIRFQGRPGLLRRVSYVDVLSGAVPAEALRGKYVLVGMTAIGMGDAHATPMGGVYGQMPGIEIIGQTLQSLRSADTLRSPPQWLVATLSALALLLMLAAFARLPQRYALALALLLVAIAGGGSVALVGAGWWITPVGFVPAALLAYPLWSWRRLELNAAALDREIALLDADALAVAAPSQANRSPHLDRRWLAFNEATERLRRARRFLAASLDGLPEAVLLADAQGSVMLANRRAAALFEVEDAGELTGLSLPRLLEEMGSASGIDWPSELRAVAEQRAALSVPVQLAGHGDFLVSVAPAPDADGPRLIVACADISSIKAAQRQREEALAFVTHDLRSPLSSIALLADLHRRGIQPLGPDAMMLEVQRLANRALTLSEDFVRLAQAESKPLEMASGDLCALVLEARRDVAPQALASAITLDFVPPAGGMAIGFFDRELLQRAVGNLLTNAIKFSPPNSKVTVSVTLREGAFLIRVQDQGPGLNAQQLSKLFGAYVRVGADPAQAGVGLGLQFVQRVADRHGGWVRAESTPGQGARFDLLVPAG